MHYARSSSLSSSAKYDIYGNLQIDFQCVIYKIIKNEMMTSEIYILVEIIKQTVKLKYECITLNCLGTVYWNGKDLNLTDFVKK